jgi:hypothetical protein
MGKSESSSGAMWGCVGAIGAAVVTGIFGLITVLLTNPDILTNRLGGLRAEPTVALSPSTPPIDPLQPAATPTIPEIDWAAVLAQQEDATPEAPISNQVAPNPGLAPPASITCPADPRTSWLTYMSTWYGPYDIYYISYDLNFFYVWDPNLWNVFTQTYGNSIFFSSYPVAAARNTWQPLNSTPFWVCIDSAGNVYAVYNP